MVTVGDVLTSLVHETQAGALEWRVIDRMGDGTPRVWGLSRAGCVFYLYQEPNSVQLTVSVDGQTIVTDDGHADQLRALLDEVNGRFGKGLPTEDALKTVLDVLEGKAQ